LFDCDYVFRVTVVLPAREGGTRVQWQLDPRVRDEGEYQYTLQVGNAGVSDNHAWRPVATGTDIWFLLDPKQRLRGNFSYTHYRIRLDTGEQTYHSRPLDTMGKLKYEDWRVFVSVMRAEHVQLSSKTGTQGLLYKRRISGAPCWHCRDHNTNEVRNAHCPHCLGTGWRGGYYKPVSCTWFNVDPGDASIQYDTETQGPTTNTRFEARAIASPLLITGDVWLNQQSSERFRIPSLTEQYQLDEIAGRDPMTPEVQQYVEDHIHKLASGSVYTSEQFRRLPVDEVQQYLPELMKTASLGLGILSPQRFGKLAETLSPSQADMLDTLMNHHGERPIHCDYGTPVEVSDEILAGL
jgi:hypothetical protein